MNFRDFIAKILEGLDNPFLKEVKELVEIEVNKRLRKVRLTTEEMFWIQQGDKIRAIKSVRTRLSLPLIEAKRIVEAQWH